MAKWLLVFILTATSLGCGGAAPPAPIEVGLIADLSSADRQAGVQTAQGIELALDELNKDAKRPIHVRQADTQGNLDAFRGQTARLLAVHPVVALIGGNSTEELRSLDAGRTTPTEDQPGLVPLLSPCGWPDPGVGKDAILIGMSPQAQGKTLARFAVQELKAARVLVVLKLSADAAPLLVDAFRAEFSLAHGEKSVPTPQVLSYGPDVKLDDLLPRINDAKPQAVLLIGPSKDLRFLSEKLIQPQPTLLFAGPDGSLRPADWHSPARVYFASAFAPDQENADFVERYRKAHQEDPDVHAALGYEAMKLLGQALQRSNDPGKLSTELFKIKDVADQQVPGLIGPLGFDDKQQLQRTLVVLRLENSVLTPVQKYRP